MYGLFCNSYDYYEWSDLVCVSASEDALRNYFDRELSPKNGYKLLSGKEQEYAKEMEHTHYVITAVALIDT